MAEESVGWINKVGHGYKPLLDLSLYQGLIKQLLSDTMPREQKQQHSTCFLAYTCTEGVL